MLTRAIHPRLSPQLPRLVAASATGTLRSLPGSRRNVLVYSAVALMAVIAGTTLVTQHKVAIIFIALVIVTALLVHAATDLTVSRVTLFVMLWGVFAANKSFAALGVGNIHVMDALLGIAVLGILVNPVGRARLRAAHAPTMMLSLFLILGAINLLRGYGWGMLALKDSVLNFYAVALLLPAALFPSIADTVSFLRKCVLPLLIGSVILTLSKLASLTGASIPQTLSITPATAAAALAAGFLFVVLVGSPISTTRVAVASLLAAGVVFSLARSVWMGALLSGMMIWLVSTRDRRRIATVGSIMFLAATTSLLLLSLQGSPVVPALSKKASSIFFKRGDPSGGTPSTAPSIGNPVANNEWRLKVWNQTIHQRIAKSILVGEGFGPPAVAGTKVGNDLHITDRRVQVHNGYLTYLMREGIAGLLAFVVLVLTACNRTVRGARNLEAGLNRTFALALFGALCIYLVDIAFGVIIEGPMAGIPFWLLIGAAFVLPNRSQIASGRRRHPEKAPIPRIE